MSAITDNFLYFGVKDSQHVSERKYLGVETLPLVVIQCSWSKVSSITLHCCFFVHLLHHLTCVAIQSPKPIRPQPLENSYFNR